jgi:cation:H+ antiporter
VTLLFLIAGFVLLIAGAELLVRGATRLALAVGVTPIIIGLTVVAFGTSAPELAVSIQAAQQGESDLTLGNVVGSNILNVLFILGASAVVLPLTVNARLIRIDVPVMVVLSLVLLLLANDGRIGRMDGVLLIGAMVAYLGFIFYESRQNGENGGNPGMDEETVQQQHSGWRSLFLVIAGLAFLVLGARWLVESATEIALQLGLSSLIVGLTIVAIGTSLPEIATSLIAAFKGERDIAVGNVIGSNIFNIVSVLGISSLVSPEGLAVSVAALRFDLPVMLAVAVACLPIFFTGSLIARWEGGLFLAYYGAYVLYLLLDSAQHDALGAYSSVMILFVFPITAFTLISIVLWEMRQGQTLGSDAKNRDE